MNFFRVDWDKLNLLLLPHILRKKMLFSFLRAVTAPVWVIYNQFTQQRDETLFLLRYDTSKRNVEIVLCKKLKTDGIYIVNNNNVDNALYLSDVADEMFYLPAYLSEQGYIVGVETIYLDDTTYLPFYINAEVKTDDFTIMVPSHIYNIYVEDIIKYATLFTLPGYQFNVLPYEQQ